MISLRGKHLTSVLAVVLCMAAASCPSPLPVATVPDCVGFSLAEAQTAIATAGLVLGSVRHAYSGIFAAGEVISQDPAPGATVAIGSEVDLVVSRGPEKVTFLDPVLDLIIRQKIGKLTGDIYSNELTGLTSLDETDRGITDLNGLEHCVNLRDLSLRMNLIADLTPLAMLSNLETLRLSSNQVSDLSPLSGLSRLTTLDVRTNQITDIAALAGLHSLESLRLDSNQITELGALAGLTALQTLSAGYNLVDDLQPLAGLVNLEYLSLNYNQIADLAPLAGLGGILTLNLNGNLVSDLESLAGLENLEWLGLSNNLISDLEPLAGLINLDSLLLGENLIVSISPLLDNTGLGTGEDDFVFLSDNPLSQTALCDDIPALELRNVTVYYHGTCD